MSEIKATRQRSFPTDEDRLRWLGLLLKRRVFNFVGVSRRIGNNQRVGVGRRIGNNQRAGVGRLMGGNQLRIWKNNQPSWKWGCGFGEFVLRSQWSAN
ncbi:MAG: hypothetical protein VYE46_03075 [Cyanobacteriota bacterium]|nr:hypothetical protein [Cyanobacteriota bacterium]